MPNDKRFLIAVFNYDRIESLIANLKKLVDLDYNKDSLVIYDCSENPRDQSAALATYCNENKLKFGEDVQFKPRVNWGMAEGARIDLATELRGLSVPYKFLIQFQDHYLDTSSEWSVWPTGKLDLEGNDISGNVKGDCIKSGFEIELSKYAELLENDNADVLYCSQDGIGLFPYWRESFFCIDGVNFATRIKTYLEIFDEQCCIALKKANDDSYEWALFAEHYVGYRMMKLGLKLCDTYYEMVFRNISDMIDRLDSGVNLTEIMHVSERYYARLFQHYMEKVMGKAT